jgi:tetratricopeptide (TPR) repeat protein
MRLLAQAIELDPLLRDAYTALGQIYRRLGHLRAELALWRRRVGIDPSDAGATERLGWVLWFTGNAAEALPWLRKSIELAPSGEWARFYVGNAHLRLGDHEAAVRAYREALEHDPEHSSAHAGVAWSLLAAHRDDEARGQLATMQASTLDGDRYFVKVADVELFLGDIERALTHARQAATAEREDRYWPRGVCPSTILAAALQGKGDGEAVRALEMSIELDQKRLEGADEGPMPRYDLAAAHALRGDHETALRWLRQAIHAGWWYPELARRDPLLGKLREDPDFIAMMRSRA